MATMSVAMSATLSTTLSTSIDYTHLTGSWIVCTLVVPLLRIEPVKQVIFCEVPETIHIFDILH